MDWLGRRGLRRSERDGRLGRRGLRRSAPGTTVGRASAGTAVGRASIGTASVSLGDGESELDSFREVRWRDGSLRVMRDWTVR